jgi:7,8-dihydropterin-6-yl-methyl-4-(beta-D-ribofuranosyl)aminobenzene 5'-phosphate synthase
MNTREVITRIILITAVVVFFASGFAPVRESLAAKTNPIGITILYDNHVFRDGTKTGWGFSCLVEHPEKAILFDTGNQPTTLFRNMNALGVSPTEVDLVVVSHVHRTHAGGLCRFLEQNNKVSVYMPTSCPQYLANQVNYAGSSTIRVDEPRKICEGVFLTGEMGNGTKEQSLILNTPQGLVIITGCAHPGIVNILEKAKEILPNRIYLVLGGFHLLGKSEEEIDKIMAEFRGLKVIKVGPTACTGQKNIESFREEYGDGFVRMGVGRTLRIE